MENMNFAEKIRLIRSKNRLSQEELADKLGVSRQTVSKWESGISYPEIEKLIAVSDMFDVSIDYLLKDNYIDDNIPAANLERTVLQFLGSAQDMEDVSEQLIDIMKDGIIDDKEKIQMEQIIRTLDTVVANIQKIKNIVLKA